MGLASELRATVSAVNETDRRLARLVGEHITKAAQGLQELKGASAKALYQPIFATATGPSCRASKLKVPELKAIVVYMNLPGRSNQEEGRADRLFSVHQAPMALPMSSYWPSGWSTAEGIGFRIHANGQLPYRFSPSAFRIY